MQIGYCESCGAKLPSKDRPTGAQVDLCEKCLTARGQGPATPPQVIAQPTSRKSSATRLSAIKTTVAVPEKPLRRTPVGGIPKAAPAAPETKSPLPAPEKNESGNATPAGSMGFYFCEKCGKRVTEADLAAGRARNKQLRGIFCGGCSEGAMTLAFDAISQEELRKDTENRRTSERRSSGPRAAPNKPAAGLFPRRSRSAAPVIGVAVLLVAFVAIAAFLFSRSQTTDTAKPGPDAVARTTAVSVNAPAKSGQESIVKPDVIQQPVIKQSVESREEAKKAPDTYDPRAAVAQSLLDQARKAFDAPPNDATAYRNSLKLIVDNHASTPAGQEAAKLLANLPPPSEAAVTVAEKAPAQIEKPAARKIEVETKHAAYAVWLKTFHRHWPGYSWVAARNCVTDALGNPALKDRQNALKGDMECVGLAESAEQAIVKGAAELKAGRSLRLEDRRNKKYEVGRDTKVTKVDGEIIEVEQNAGDGKISFRLPLNELTPQTRFALARIGVPDDGKGKLALALLRFADVLKSGSPRNDTVLTELLDQARSTQAPAEGLSRIDEWLALVDREKRAADALEGVDKLIDGGKIAESQAALEKFVVEHAETAFLAENADRIPELEKRIDALNVQSGLLASYFSGSIEDHRKQYHCSRPLTSLEHDFGSRGPGEGVPGERFDVELNGILRIQQPGEYTFIFIGDDFLSVWVDGKCIGNAQWDRQITAKVNLTAGDHAFKAVHSNNVVNSSFRIRWKKPGSQRDEKIPPQVLFHRPSDAPSQRPAP